MVPFQRSMTRQVSMFGEIPFEKFNAVEFIPLKCRICEFIFLDVVNY